MPGQLILSFTKFQQSGRFTRNDDEVTYFDSYLKKHFKISLVDREEDLVTLNLV